MTRLARAWRALGPEQRLAAIAAIGLFVSMFLPWYSQTNTVVVGDAARATRTSLSAFDAFSFVEAAVLLVSAGVLATLFARAEQRSFRLPGGDGLIVMVAGGWTAVLLFYRTLDKPGLHGTARITATVGVQWGIFIALLLALGLMYAGARMRSAQRPEPPITRPAGRSRHERPAPPRHARAAPVGAERQTQRQGQRQSQRQSDPPGDPPPGARRPRYPPAPADQLSFEDPPGAAE
jgi:hypothetical protein